MGNIITNIVDSRMSQEDILAQNPQSPAPIKIIDSLEILNVKYYSFDGRLHQGQIVINKKVAPDVKSFFDLAVKLKFPIKKVIPISNEKYRWDDEISCNDNNSSGYNYRLIAGTNRISKHAAGLAFDVNPVQNIYIKYQDTKEIYRAPKNGFYDEQNLGTLTQSHPLVVHMKKLGWEWGGDWKPESGRVDYQHFEKNIT